MVLVVSHSMGRHRLLFRVVADVGFVSFETRREAKGAMPFITAAAHDCNAGGGLTARHKGCINRLGANTNLASS